MKISVFIDNSNVFKNIKRIQEDDPEWTNFYNPLILAQKIAGNRELVDVNFYCTRPPSYLLGEDVRHKKIYKVTNRYYAAVEKIEGVTVKYGELKGGRGSPQEKNLDTQLTGDLVADAALSKFDAAIIVSSDGDYVGAVDNAKKFGKKIEVVSFKGFSSMRLRQICDVSRRARRSFFQPLDFKRD